MEKLMPIIPGCKALMAPTRFETFVALERITVDLPAHEVKVVERHKPWISGDRQCPKCGSRSLFWSIQSPMMEARDRYAWAYNCACQLTRIDGGDFEQEAQQANKELWWESRLRQLEKNQAELDRLAKNDQFFWGLSAKQIQDQLRRNFG